MDLRDLLKEWPPELVQKLKPSKVHLGNLVAMIEAVGVCDEFADVRASFEQGASLGYEGPRTTRINRSKV